MSMSPLEHVLARGPVHIWTFEIQGYLKKKFKTVLLTYVLLSAVNEVNINNFIRLRKQWH